jgi:hypothetical protein
VLGVTRSEAEGRSPAELLHLLRGRRRGHRRTTFFLSWFLEELQVVLQHAIARGVRLAFSDTRRLPPFESAGEFADRAPRFDVEIEDADDGQ